MLSKRSIPSIELVGDVAMAILLTVSITAASSQMEPASGDRPLDALGYGIIAFAAGVLAGRRRTPLTVVIVIAVALSAYLARNYVGGPIFVTAWLALYSLATIRNRRCAIEAAAGVSALLVVIGLAADTGSPALPLVFVGWAAVAVLLGDSVQSRRQHVLTLEERARYLEQTREAETRRRVSEERLRIARDLHDGVAHSMAAINVQAGVAAHVMDRRPDQAREALVAIKEASRDVLDEMAALLGLMREPDQAIDRAPLPGLDQLESLVASSHRAGRQAILRLAPPSRVPRAVAVAAYRIVQESLTNISRHASTDASAIVTISDAGDGGLMVEVTDDGTSAGEPGTGSGLGITGMQERAEASGGTFASGARPSGGFFVRARWPASP